MYIMNNWIYFWLSFVIYRIIGPDMEREISKVVLCPVLAFQPGCVWTLLMILVVHVGLVFLHVPYVKSIARMMSWPTSSMFDLSSSLMFYAVWGRYVSQVNELVRGQSMKVYFYTITLHIIYQIWNDSTAIIITSKPCRTQALVSWNNASSSLISQIICKVPVTVN